MTSSNNSSLIPAVLSEASQHFTEVLKNCWKEILGFLILFEVPLQYFLSIKSKFAGHPDTEVVVSLGLAMCSMLVSITMIFLIPLRAHELKHGIKKRGLFSFAQLHALAFIVEGLKFFAITMLGFLFFILPGVYLYLRLVFNSFVVMFDDSYYSDKKSAIKESWEMSRGYGLEIFVLFVVIAVMSYPVEAFRTKFDLINNPDPLWILGFGLFVGVTTLSYSIMYATYSQLRERYSSPKTVDQGAINETHISVERD